MIRYGVHFNYRHRAMAGLDNVTNKSRGLAWVLRSIGLIGIATWPSTGVLIAASRRPLLK